MHRLRCSLCILQLNSSEGTRTVTVIALRRAVQPIERPQAAEPRALAEALKRLQGSLRTIRGGTGPTRMTSSFTRLGASLSRRPVSLTCAMAQRAASSTSKQRYWIALMTPRGTLGRLCVLASTSTSWMITPEKAGSGSSPSSLLTSLTSAERVENWR